MPSYSLAEPVVLAFVAIPVLLLGAFTWGIHSAWRRHGADPGGARRAALWSGAAGTAWMAATWLAADTGILRAWDRMPPPLAVLVFAVFSLAALISFGRAGARLATLPLWVLVGIHGFRLPLELAMHAMHDRGIMPEVMSYTGRNFDIVTGVTALAVAALVAAGRSGRRLVAAWNVIGTALLLNVIVVAILATPMFRFFGEEQLNVWVTYPPFVWLPAVMVLAALAGHAVVFRAVLRS